MPKRSMSVYVDLRSFGAVHYEYFGNALYFSVVELEDGVLLSSEVAVVFDRIRQHMEGVKEEDVGSVVRWMEEQHYHWKEGF